MSILLVLINTVPSPKTGSFKVLNKRGNQQGNDSTDGYMLNSDIAWDRYKYNKIAYPL